MNTKTIVSCVICLIMTGPVANADESNTLVQLDKEWGEAQGPEAVAPLLANNILTLTSVGVVNKEQMLEAAANDVPTGPYIAEDYDIRFLSEDIAVMVHSAGEPDPHRSMHVWQKLDGKWQVVANANVPIEE
jgi:hypothetical protein